MPAKTRFCLLCGEKPAIRLNSSMKYATSDRIFCTQRCAADWALVHVCNEDNASDWCPKHGVWFNSIESETGCEGCIADLRKAEAEAEQATADLPQTA